MSSRDKFAQSQSNLADRGLGAMFKQFRSVNELYAPEPSFLCTLFDKLVMPVLLYGSEIWGPHKAVDMEKVHLLFCKTILHLRRNTANYFIYGELGRYPLNVDCKLGIIRYWLKTSMSKHNTLVYNMYQSTHRNCKNDISLNGWTATIKSLLFSLGLNVVWYNQGVVIAKSFEHVLKQRVQDNYITERTRAVANSKDSGILYITYKLKPFYSPFINSLTKPSYRYSFLKFVTKNHNLPVVRGKWFQPNPYNERL